MTCRSCGADIDWVRTTSGKAMPVEPRDGGNIRLVDTGGVWTANVVADGMGTHVSHFATCPYADSHRRSRRAR